MSKARLFPHFSRIFSASLLWISLTLLLIVNFYAQSTMLPSYWGMLTTVLYAPTSQAHITLGQTYREHGFYTAARRELLLAYELSGDRDVLGATSPTRQLLEQWGNEPTKILEEYQLLQKTVREKPDYRDAYISLTAHAYQLSRLKEGREYISQAMSLDPNNEIARNFLPLFP